MEVVVSFVVAFVLSAIAQVMKDLGQGPMDRPGWARRPTFGGAFLAGVTWFARPFIDAYVANGQVLRAIAFGLLGVSVQLAVLTGFCWAAISISINYLDNPLLQLAAVVAIVVVGAPIVLPIASIALIPITLLIALPLDLLFPLKTSPEAANVRWCRNCAHYRKAKDYEETFDGLWGSDEMPRSDHLPCKIVAEAIDTWRDYYGTDRSQRTLFPKDCPHFKGI